MSEESVCSHLGRDIMQWVRCPGRPYGQGERISVAILNVESGARYHHSYFTIPGPFAPQSRLRCPERLTRAPGERLSSCCVGTGSSFWRGLLLLDRGSLPDMAVQLERRTDTTRR